MTVETWHIELLKELISIPSLSRQEHRLADRLEDLLGGLGHKVKRIRNNLLLGDSQNGDRGFTLLLNSHLDTVGPVEGWETDPFEPIDSGDRITGLGSNDAGASVVSMISAYHRMANELSGKVNLLLLISAEEEVSGADGIEAVLPGLGKIDAAVVGEPTGMQPAVAERGLMVLDGTVRGVAGHAARKEGTNAIYEAMQDVEAIGALSFPQTSGWLPEASAQVTMISSGTAHNVVPDTCRYVVDVRSNDIYDNERMLKILTGVCRGELVPRSTRLKPSVLGDDHLLMHTVREMKLTPFGSSTLSDMALIPFPALKMGPGESSRSHTAGEYILRSELEAGIAGYCHFLEVLGRLVPEKSLK
jgi:acetylornithine deacetylase